MDNKSLEGKLAEFKEIVNKISDPDIDIDESVKLFESGVKLSKDIEEKPELIKYILFSDTLKSHLYNRGEAKCWTYHLHHPKANQYLLCLD